MYEDDNLIIEYPEESVDLDEVRKRMVIAA